MRPVDLREDENMAEEKMIIEIGEDGAISVDLNGFKGQGCAAIMDLMEKALGPARRNNKPEYDTRAGARTSTTDRVKTTR